MKSGFVSILGRTNVGKSSIINSLVGEKVAAVANKTQTTRTIIRAIVNRPNSQIIFIDTPGIHKPDLHDPRHSPMPRPAAAARGIHRRSHAAHRRQAGSLHAFGRVFRTDSVALRFLISIFVAFPRITRSIRRAESTRTRISIAVR